MNEAGKIHDIRADVVPRRPLTIDAQRAIAAAGLEQIARLRTQNENAVTGTHASLDG